MSCKIEICNLEVEYELYHSRTDNLKEYLVRLLSGKKPSGGGVTRFKALQGLNLTFNRGERIGIVGHNGAGKSTLLKVIAGILKPTNGSLLVQGSIQPLIEVGAGFNPDLTGRENIYLNGYMLGFSKEALQQKESEIIEFSELGEFIDTPVKYYSSGMAVRLAFTIATSIDPEILVFDEMLGAGDVNFLAKAKGRINGLLDQAKMLIIVSHDLEILKNYVERIIVLNRGELIFDGPLDQGLAVYLDKMKGVQSHL